MGVTRVTEITGHSAVQDQNQWEQDESARKAGHEQERGRRDRGLAAAETGMWGGGK